jgi:hypothetical protein
VFNVASVSGAGGNLRVSVRAVDKTGTVTNLFSATSVEAVTGPGQVVLRVNRAGFPILGVAGYSLRLAITSTGEEISFVVGDNTSYAIMPITLVGDTSGIGAQGPQGVNGLDGVQGVIGFQGEIGAQGPQGFQGWQGFQGTGNNGFQGVQGEVGSQGNQGRQGGTTAATLSTTAVTSGTGETLIFKAQIPANSVSVGDTFEMSIFGISSSTGTVTFRVRAGANGSTSDTQVWIGTTSAATVANRRSGFNGLLVVRSIGASGTVQCECLAFAHTSQLPTVVAAVTTPTVSTTAIWNIDITCTCTVGTWTAQSAFITKR